MYSDNNSAPYSRNDRDDSFRRGGTTTNFRRGGRLNGGFSRNAASEQSYYERRNYAEDKKSPSFRLGDIQRVLAKCSPSAFAIGRAADVMRGLYETCGVIQVFDPHIADQEVWNCNSDRELNDRSFMIERTSVFMRGYQLPGVIAYISIRVSEFNLADALHPEKTDVFIKERFGSRYLSFRLNKALMEATGWDVAENHPESVRSMLDELIEAGLITENDTPVVREFRRYHAASETQQAEMLPNLTEMIRESSNPQLFMEQLQ